MLPLALVSFYLHFLAKSHQWISSQNASPFLLFMVTYFTVVFIVNDHWCKKMTQSHFILQFNFSQTQRSREEIESNYDIILRMCSFTTSQVQNIWYLGQIIQDDKCDMTTTYSTKPCLPLISISLQFSYSLYSVILEFSFVNNLSYRFLTIWSKWGRNWKIGSFRVLREKKNDVHMNAKGSPSK